jgi:hypothetical protein
MLKCVRNHLDENGVFIIDNTIPDAEMMINENNKKIVSEYPIPSRNGKYICNFTPYYDFAFQIERDEIYLEEYINGKIERKASTTVDMTFFFPREIKMYLLNNGFEIIKEMGSLKGDKLKPGSREMIFISKLSG